jgi:hypothetical protein
MIQRGTHGERADCALRRLREALLPIQEQFEFAAQAQGQVVNISASPAFWQRVSDALRDTELWPLELLGPVEVQSVGEDGKPVRVPAWFTRGWHHHETFVMFARSKSRGMVGGGRLKLRECPINMQVHQAWWAPPAPESGRDSWGPLSSDVAAAEGAERRVPVTVWENPGREG